MTAGSLHLVGGGWGGDGAVWRSFLDATGVPSPRIAVVVVRDGDGEEHASKLVQSLEAAGPFEPRLAVLAHGEAVPPAVLDDVDGVLVGGGVPPAYLDALLPLAGRIRELVAAGRPYAGFSAGSAIAARRALVGGWLQDGVPVVDREIAEGLDPLTVRKGLGLTDLTVDVHAAQWGTLARLIAAVEAGLVPSGAAIDEDSALVIRSGRPGVEGTGNVWWVEAAGGAVVVRREPAGR